MKSNTRILIGTIVIVLGVIMTIIGVMMAITFDHVTGSEDDVNTIARNYTELNGNINNVTELRTQLVGNLNEFSNETYPNEHDNYVEMLNKYNTNIQYIDKNIKNMKSMCDKKYADDAINIMCTNYDRRYEEVINLYITDLNSYNDKVNSYNETSEKDYELFEMLHKEYIDWNQDGTYTGKSA